MDEKQFYEKSLKDQKDPKKFFKVLNKISKAKNHPAQFQLIGLTISLQM